MRAFFLFSVQLNTNLQWKKNNVYIYILFISIYLYKRSIKLTQCLRLFQHKPPPQPVQYLILMTIAHQIRHPLANAARCYCSQARTPLWSSSSPVGSDCSQRVWLGKSGAASWRSVWSLSQSDLLAVSPSWFFVVFWLSTPQALVSPSRLLGFTVARASRLLTCLQAISFRRLVKIRGT